MKFEVVSVGKLLLQLALLFTASFNTSASTLSTSAPTAAGSVTASYTCTGVFCELQKSPSWQTVKTSASPASFTATFSPGSHSWKLRTHSAVGSGLQVTETDIVNFTVVAPNTAPTISSISHRTISEDSTAFVGFTIGDAETAANSLVLTKSTTNSTFSTLPSIVFTGGGTQRTLRVTPAANSFGRVDITIFVRDGGNLTVSRSFRVTVNSVNDTPTMTSIGSKTISEDSNTGNIPFTVGDVETPAGNLQLSYSTHNSTLPTLPDVSFGGSGANRTIKVTPSTNESGTISFTVVARDAGNRTIGRNFSVTVNSVNDRPTISNISNKSIDEDSNTGFIPFTIGDQETAVGSLSVTATSSNTTLIPNGNFSWGGSGGSRSIKVTPAANKSGNATISVKVSDGNLTKTDTFIVTVNAKNDRPTISNITNKSIDEDGNTGFIPFVIADQETAAGSLLVTATSSNTTLVPNGSFTWGGSGSNRSIKVTPAANKSGSTTISVRVSDGSLSKTNTFIVEVNSVNDRPTMSSFASQTISEGGNTGNVGFTIGDAETPVSDLTLSTTINTSTLATAPTVNFVGSGANRTIQITPEANESGNISYTVIVTDSGGRSEGKIFSVTVTEVNDGPTISNITNRTINEDVINGTGFIPFTVSDIDTPVEMLTVTAVSSNTGLISNGNMEFQGSGSSRNIKVTSIENQSGSSTITVRVSDGTLIAEDTFVVTVTSENDTPNISSITGVTIAEDGNTGDIAFTVSDAETAANLLGVEVTSIHSRTLANNPVISFGGSGVNRTIRVTPVENDSGQVSFTVVVTDGSGVTDGTNFSITVEPVNDAPAILDIDDVTINEDTVNGTGYIPFNITDVDNAAETLVVTATSSNLELIPNENLNFEGSGGERFIRALPLATQFGSSTITLTVSDGTLTTENTFLVTVEPVNNRPTISTIPSVIIAENSSTENIAFTIGDIETPAEELELRVTSIHNLTLLTEPEVTFGGSGANRTIQVTPAEGETGDVSFTVVVSDGSGKTAGTNFSVAVRVDGGGTPNDLAEFNYNLMDKSFLPNVSGGDFVAITQGAHSVSQGVMSYLLPLDLPPVINNLKPSLGLAYSSGNNASGVAGVGWSISGLSAITRCHLNLSQDGEVSKSKYGKRLCLNGKRLKVISEPYPPEGVGQEGPPEGYFSYWAANAEYRLETNATEVVQSESNNEFFVVKAKNGNILTYGGQADGQNSRVYKQGSPDIILKWALDSVEDRYGNRYTLHYDRNTETGEHYIKHISLSPKASVVFNYKNREGSDVSWGYDQGYKYQHTKILESITTYINVFDSAIPDVGVPVKQWDIDYKVSAITNRYLVDEIAECGFYQGSKTCARPLSFQWQTADLGFEAGNYHLDVCSSTEQVSRSSITQIVDINNDNLNDILTTYHVYLRKPEGCFELQDWMSPEVGPEAQWWKGIQAIKTKQGYALASVGESGGILRLKTLDFENSTIHSSIISETSLESNNNRYRSLMLVTDDNRDGLNDIYFGNSYFTQHNTNDVTFLERSISNYAFISSLTEDRNSKLEATWVDIDGDKDLELFFTDPKFAAYEALAPHEKDDFQGEIPTDNFVHYFFSTLDGRLSKEISDDGEVVDNSLPVSDIGTFRPSSGFANIKGQRAGLYRGFADFNRDGVTDLIYHKDGRWMVRTFTQDSENPFGQVLDTGFSVDQATHIYPYDYNKDGILDVIDCNNRVLISGYAEGDFAFIQDIDGEDSQFPFGTCGENYSDSLQSAFKGDINNDGVTDFFGAQTRIAKTVQPDMLQVVTDGFGAQIKFEYSTLTTGDDVGDPFYTPSESVTFPIMHASRSMQAVKTVFVSNGLNGFETQDYRYYAAKADSHGRGFLGFEKIKVINNSKNILTTTTYRQDYPYVKRIEHAITETLSGTSISETGMQYHQFPSALGGYLSYSPIAYNVTYTVNPDFIGQVASANITTSVYDSYSNLKHRGVKVGNSWPLSGNRYQVGGMVTNTLQDNEYINDPETGLIGFLERSEVTYINADGDQKLVVTEYEPEPGTLDVKVQYNFVEASDESIKSTVTTLRNAKGVVSNVSTSAKDIDGGTMATRSDAFSDFENDIFPGKITNAKSHVTNLTHKLKFGSVKTSTTNGLTTTNIYDALGRLIENHDERGTITRSSSFYCSFAPSGITCPGNAVYGTAVVVTNPAEYNLGEPLTVTYYDLLQREVRSEVYNFNQDIIKVDTQYYRTGELEATSQPYKGNTITGYWTRYSDYDVLGRAQKITKPDGGEVTYRYDKIYGPWLKTFITTKVIAPNGIEYHEKSTLVNAAGQVKRARDTDGVRVDYTYGPMGNLEATIVDNNDQTKIVLTYDLAGNRTNMSDPDVGDIQFAFNGFGELRRQTWDSTGSAKSITYIYDVLGRKVRRIDAGGSTSATYNWVWDTTKEGMLHNVSGNGYSTTYGYNLFSQLETERTTLSGLGEQEFIYTYDNFGRPDRTSYPSGLMTEQLYHAAGTHARTLTLTGSPETKAIWVQGKTSDNQGRLKHELFGNGIVTGKTYKASNGLVSNIVSGSLQEDGVLTGHVQNLSYEFDSLGNLYSRKSERQDIAGNSQEQLSESFIYDKQYRLRQSAISIEGIPQGTQFYNYNRLGNLTSRTDIGTLSYESTGNAGVHAVTHANGTDYGYDVYGNLTSRNSETLAYDAFNKPTRIGTTNFSYGPNHERYKKSDGGKTTYYLAGGQYEVEINGNERTQKTYVGGYLVQSQTITSGEPGELTNTYLHKDHIGSVDAITSDTGNYLGRSSFNAWGSRRKTDWSVGEVDEITDATTHGFTGHEMLDELDLIHMNGRVYDPVIGRFLSPDIMIQAPFNSQSYNRYSYVLNNPLSFADPSGYEAIEEVVVYGTKATLSGNGAYSMQGQQALNWIQDYSVNQGGSFGMLTYVGAAIVHGMVFENILGAVDAGANGDFTGVAVEGAQAVLKPLKAVDKLGALVDTKKLKQIKEKLKGALSSNTSKSVDTASDTSRQALRKAKEANGIPKSAQPDRIIKPNTPEGNQLGLDSRNVKQYEYTNSSGQKISIRQDKAAGYGQGGVGDQRTHFNAGPTGQKLKQHHYYGD